MSLEFLYIITARKNSKRLKDKNIRLFAGKPLICWSIEQALRVSKQDKVVVSSDDNRIKKISKNFKNVNFIQRPKYLATDKASTIDAIKQVIKKLSFEGFVVILQPTSPLRLDKDIENAKKLLIDGSPAVMSQVKLQYPSNKINVNSKSKYFKSFKDKKNYDLYAPNGAIFAANTNWIKKINTFYSSDVVTFNMDEMHSIDIDTKYHFETAEFIFKKLK